MNPIEYVTKASNDSPVPNIGALGTALGGNVQINLEPGCPESLLEHLEKVGNQWLKDCGTPVCLNAPGLYSLIGALKGEMLNLVNQGYLFRRDDGWAFYIPLEM